MSVIRTPQTVREIYAEAAKKGWVIPCFCSENLTTTEAILSAAEDYRVRHGLQTLPITVAMTCRYPHRSQAPNYTHTRRADTGLKLFTESVKVLAENGGPFSNLQVLIHLDHIQPDLDAELLSGDLSDYASIMFDASGFPFEENIRKTSEFVKKRRNDILIEGACDEIVDAVGEEHNALTTPENAKRFKDETGADLVVCNLGTEHRARGKELKYYGDVCRQIRDVIGSCIVLHGTSSVSNDQLRTLAADGICKVNLWTALERDSTPVLFSEMVKNARKVAGEKTVQGLVEDGYLTERANAGEPVDIAYFTTMYRQDIIFSEMRKAVGAYLDLWYGR